MKKKHQSHIDKEYADRQTQYIFIDDMIDNMSGWKLHIFGLTINDSVYIYNQLYETIVQYKLCLKVASPIEIQKYVNNRNSEGYGKCGTIYLSSSIFRNGLLNKLINEIKIKLIDYKPDISKSYIYGDEKIDNVLYYRYELSKIIDIKVGVTYDDYKLLYEPNRGYYNLGGNIDPFKTMKHIKLFEAYFEDLTQYNYDGAYDSIKNNPKLKRFFNYYDNHVNIGWIDKNHDFNKGDVPSIFFGKIRREKDNII